jgi:hypothetical protein
MTKQIALNLPDVGPRRYWEIKHQPQKKTAPLRIELREHTKSDGTKHVESWTRLLGFEDTIAMPAEISAAANKVFERALRVDEFVGQHGNMRAAG